MEVKEFRVVKYYKGSPESMSQTDKLKQQFNEKGH